MTRPLTAGPDNGPAPPFPIKVRGRIVKGFGRGSKELGIPTANIPIEGLSVGGHSEIESGVYFGWAGLLRDERTTTDADNAPAAVPGGLAKPAPSTSQTTPQNDISSSSTSSSSSSTTTTTSPNGTSNNDTSTATDDRAQIYPMVMSIGWNPYYKNAVRSVEVHIMHDFSADFYNAKMTLSILGFIRPERDYDSMDALIEDIRTDIEVSRRSLEREAYQRLKGEVWLSDFGFE